ncbi:MAG: DUF2807 domain-containing protein [Bacteroidetes bacterium]|nr:MAG: DUF2807 domain-containing protein [Bacteroidota bacterium]
MTASFKTLTFAFVLIAMGFLTSCEPGSICTVADGPQESRTLDLPRFAGIDLKVPADVYLSQDTAFSVVITGPSDVLDKIEHDVIEGIWEADLRGCVINSPDITIEVTMPDLSYLRIGGSGDVMGRTPFVVPSAELIISGSGSIDLIMTADDVSTTINGSGDIYLDLVAKGLKSLINGSGNLDYTGEVEQHSSQIRGSGDIMAYDLMTSVTEVAVSGSGNSEVQVGDQLDVQINGSGDVYYKGQPQVEVRINGSGKVVNMN